MYFSAVLIYGLCATTIILLVELLLPQSAHELAWLEQQKTDP